MSQRTIFTLLSAILVIGAFFRFYDIGSIPPGLYPDEAMNGNNALEALATGDFKIFYPENNGREGLFINIQAASVALFGNEPWALRIVSALFGTLTVLGVFLLARELLYTRRWRDEIALGAAFFIATSFWHVNFSRIGFRAIMVAFLSSFAMYFLLKAFRTGKISSMAFAGIFAGLGFHTYISYRFMPFVFAVPVLWYLWRWYKENQKSKIKNQNGSGNSTTPYCIPCAAILFIFVVFVVALPIGLYFLGHPEDFTGRGGQVSIFSAEQPLVAFAKSNALTLGMFFVHGDCNWRHNLPCKPELNPIVAFFFVVGIVTAFRQLRGEDRALRLAAYILFAWLAFLSLPATLTTEGMPHAIRAIGMTVPVFILAGLGAAELWGALRDWIERKKTDVPERAGQIERIRRELAILAVLVMLLVPLGTARDYFLRWAIRAETYFAFGADLVHIGQHLAALPNETKKYVIVNLGGVDVRGVPMPAQSVMYITDSFRSESQEEKNISYIPPEALDSVPLPAPGEKIAVIPLEGNDRALIASLRKKFPGFSITAPSDFILVKN